MGDELAGSNVNRSYSLAATSIAIFTFMLVLVYPRLGTAEINTTLFEVTLIAVGVATFAFVLAALHYYSSSLGQRINDRQRAIYGRRADRLWLVGFTLLLVSPSLVLFSIGLVVPGVVWLGLWLVYVLFAALNFRRMETAPA